MGVARRGSRRPRRPPYRLLAGATAMHGTYRVAGAMPALIEAHRLLCACPEIEAPEGFESRPYLVGGRHSIRVRAPSVGIIAEAIMPLAGAGLHVERQVDGLIPDRLDH